MANNDLDRMKEAITWAEGCKPVKDSIPKVGAIIVVGDKVVGRGRRGTGETGDDQHAESDALDQIKNKTELPQATLYTTLEPCTPEVRSIPLECCTHLILQHKIKRVFVGILDPNQGVTGKGLWRLQDNDVDVQLFPHNLAQRIRAMNAPFVRAQMMFGPTIMSPTNGEMLKTYETAGRHTVRFKCLNPPAANNYLLSFAGGNWWPQPGPFRHVEKNIWEIDAHFGSTGDHILHLVTCNELAEALVQYYRKIVKSNLDRRERFKVKLQQADMLLLGGDYAGIPMTGLPKGFRSEAAVRVTIAATPTPATKA